MERNYTFVNKKERPGKNEDDPSAFFYSMVYTMDNIVSCHEISLMKKQFKSMIHLNIQESSISLLSLLHEYIKYPRQIIFTENKNNGQVNRIRNKNAGFT